MGSRMLDPTGYFIGDLYMIYKYIGVKQDEYGNYRYVFEAMGIPMERMMSVSPILVGGVDFGTAVKFTRDYDLSINLPPILKE